jgi:hypothetical protein
MTADIDADSPHQARLLDRCCTCGRKAVNEGQCAACGTRIADSAYVEPRTKFGSVLSDDGKRIAANSELTGLTPNPRLELGPSHATARRVGKIPADDKVLQGRVIMVQQRLVEPPDPDPWKWVAIPAWGLLLFLSPLLAAIATGMASGLVAGVTVFVAVALVLRFIFSNRLYESWQFVAALRGRHVVEPVPLVTFRVRSASGREMQVRMKGYTSSGAVVEGDRVSAEGRWRDGVLRARTVFCQRTGAITRPRQPNAFSLALSGISLLAAASLWLSLIGIPWSSEKVSGFAKSKTTQALDRRGVSSARPIR